MGFLGLGGENSTESEAQDAELQAKLDEALDDAHRAWQLVELLQEEGVFIASKDLGVDREGNVVEYTNAQGKRILEKFGGDLRQFFGIDSSQVQGGSIHRFHKDPDRIRGILRSLTAGQTRKNEPIRLGENTLQTYVNALTDRAGETVAYALSAKDATDELRNQRLVESITSVAGDLASNSDSVADLTNQAVQATEQIARDSQSQQENVGGTSDSVSQMATVISGVAQSSQNVAENSAKALDIAETGREVVTESVASM